MSPKVDVGLCMRWSISDAVTKYIPVKIFVISNSPQCVKNPSIQLISRSTLHACWLRIINAIQSSLWAGPGSCWQWARHSNCCWILFPVSRTRLLLDPELARWLVRLSGDDGVVSCLKTAVLQMGFPGGANGKELCRRHKRHGLDPWAGQIPWKRAWQPTPGFLLGELHGQRSLVGYSPQGGTESDTSEWLSMHTQVLKIPPYFKCSQALCFLRGRER